MTNEHDNFVDKHRLYLKGISSGEMGEALKVLVGPDATGLSASMVSRLK